MNNYLVMQQNGMPYQYSVQAPIPVNRNEQMPPIAAIANKITKSNDKGTITLPPISSIVGKCNNQQQMMPSPPEVPHYQNIGLVKLTSQSPPQPQTQPQQYHYYVPPPRSITPCLSSNNGSPDFSHSNLVAMSQQQLNANGTIVMDRSLSNYSNCSMNSQVLESTATTPISTPPSAFSSRSASTSSLQMPTVFEGQRTGSLVNTHNPTTTPPVSITTKAPKKTNVSRRSKSHSPTLKSRNDSTSITVSAIDELSKLRKQCPVCGKICSRPSTLKTHYLIHTGDTPFKCPWQDCKKSFNVKSNMLRHLKCHERKKLSKTTSCT
ncbi:hypothetical protein RNJ44_01200 [Nakaseomyces bracarensis]|uniref:C2H2-type domain-containing protein n=1 Tax=Nakaseomyces bracarensis TaxID=273131 RepID=A0ABR4NRF9_9SACH